MTDSPTTATGTDSQRADGTRGTPAPQVLCDTQALAVITTAPAGKLWTLSEHGRELDASITHLLPGQHVNTHTEEDPDVLLLILAGDATLAGPHGPRHLTEGTLLWLPRGSVADLAAGENGLSCLTVHRCPPGTPNCHTKQSTPRQPLGPSPAPPGDTTRPDWPRWLC
jgi:quercetin dioxygenase-like cupin family protein